MRPLLAALVLAAALVSSAAGQPGRRVAAKPRPQTLYSSPSGPIAAFGQDGPLLAWLARGSRGCNTVRVLSLTNGGHVQLPTQTGGAQNVTCRWNVVQPARLALGRSGLDSGPYVLWTLYEKLAPLEFDYVLGAGVSDPRERRFRQIAHSSQGIGLWLGGIAGDGSNLVYALTTVQYVDEVACLSGGSCERRVAGGGIRRVSGRSDPLIPNTTAAVAVAAAGASVAYVPAGPTVGRDGRPLASADLPLEVRDIRSGALLARALPAGTPVAIALSAHVLAALEQTPRGLRLAWYSPSTGAAAGSVAVPAGTAPELSANDQTIVFRVGRSIRAVDVASRRTRRLARAASTPVGVSLERNRLAWAENVKGKGRIRAVSVAKG
jgi:hypothetical protein